MFSWWTFRNQWIVSDNKCFNTRQRGRRPSATAFPDAAPDCLWRSASGRAREPAFQPRWTFPHASFPRSNVYQDENFELLYNAIKSANGVFIAAPVYNWSLGGVVKNIIEATGSTGENGRRSAWFDQIVTFLCSGSLHHGYMAYSSLAQSLMLDFKCIVNPYVVYSTDRDWVDEGELSEQLRNRLKKTVEVKIELSEALKQRRYSSGWEI